MCCSYSGFLFVLIHEKVLRPQFKDALFSIIFYHAT